MSRATKMIAAFVIVIFRPLISAILTFFLFDFSKKNLKCFRKIRFPAKHKKKLWKSAMGFRVTILFSTKLQVIYFLYRGIFLSQNKHFLKKSFLFTPLWRKKCGVAVATTRQNRFRPLLPGNLLIFWSTAVVRYPTDLTIHFPNKIDQPWNPLHQLLIQKTPTGLQQSAKLPYS